MGILRTRKGLAAVGVVCALYGWSLLTALGVFGAAQVPKRGAAAFAFEYQYSTGHVTGGGQILKSVTFDLEAKGDTRGVRGTCNVVEKKTHHVLCRTVTSLLIVGTHATITGEATDNGVPTTYTIEVDDLSESGRGADTFSIITGTGFSRSGVLTAGNIQIHG
jgi:hypothetical protein